MTSDLQQLYYQTSSCHNLYVEQSTAAWLVKNWAKVYIYDYSLTTHCRAANFATVKGNWKVKKVNISYSAPK